MVPAIREARARVSSVGITAPGTEFFRPETKPKFRPVSPARDQISKTVRRTGRANAACSHKVSVTRDSGDCLVADAVLVEPVSTAKFPANREKNREFRKIVASRAPEIRNNGLGTGLLTQIPYSTEQGIILAEQGIFARTGNFITRARELDTSPDAIFATKRVWVMSALPPKADMCDAPGDVC